MKGLGIAVPIGLMLLLIGCGQGEAPKSTDNAKAAEVKKAEPIVEEPEQVVEAKMAEPSGKVYVGNLSWGTTEDELREAFSRFGELNFTRVITDRETGRSRGFGFVRFKNIEAAEKGIAEMNGTDLDGRIIVVHFAEIRRAKNPRGTR